MLFEISSVEGSISCIWYLNTFHSNRLTMRSLIIGGLAFIAFILFARWHYVCEIKGLCGDRIEAPADYPIVEEGTIDLEEDEKFEYVEKEVLPNLNSENKARIASIVTQMKSDPNINLVVKGAFTKEEKEVKPDFFENLGIARADAVRKMLTDEGIDEDRISLDFEEAAHALSNPIAFELTRKEIEAAQYTFSNMTFNDITFPTASAVFRNPPRQFRLYADSLKSFLVNNPNKRVTVIGHTDNEGEEELNYKLGIRRGDSVEYYLRTQVGIKSPISVASRGETAPVASNDTPEGGSKKRNNNRQIRHGQYGIGQ